jgi:hypothetical protein
MSWGGNGLTRGVGRCESELVFERGTRRSGNGHPIQLILYLFTAVARFGGTLQFVRGQTLVLGWWRPGQLRPPPTPQTPQPIEPSAPREPVAPRRAQQLGTAKQTDGTDLDGEEQQPNAFWVWRERLGAPRGVSPCLVALVPAVNRSRLSLACQTTRFAHRHWRSG